MRHVTVTIEIPDHIEEITGETIPEIKFTVMSQGVDADVIVPLLLSAAEGQAQAALLEQFRGADPMEQQDTIDALAMLNARLKVVDTVMHLPMRPLESSTYSEM